MELNDIKPNVEVLGDDMEEQFFSIADTGMVFNILRNKLYSNAVLAICREISCNARDAHREVGTPDLPIQISLPTYMEKSYKIKDFGPGISPDRMSNIFIKYTASTKRKDNVQTGGFGLGAKTPFSYSDSFSIVTIHGGIRYNYNCFIDPTKVGKIALSGQVPTDEPSGTEIIIPVLDKDFQQFAMFTEQACRHWSVKPVIKGGEIQWTNPKMLLEGNGWSIAHTGDHYGRHCKVIIDGIEYPLEIDTIRKWADSQVIDSARGNLMLYFGVGQLSLSANREQLSLDEPTQAIIRARLEEVVKDIKKGIQEKLDSFDNLWDANIYYRYSLKAGFSSLAFLGEIKWNDIVVNDSYINLACPAFTYSKDGGRRSKDPNKLTRRNTHNFQFGEHIAVYINDLALKEPTPRHVRKAFDDDPTLETLLLIVPTDKVTEQVLNDTIHLDQMKVKRLSSITKASTRAYTPASSRLLIFKFDVNSCAFRQVSYASLDEEANLKVLCKTVKDAGTNTRRCSLKDGYSLSWNNLQTLARKFTAYSFYGVDASVPQERLDEEFSEFMEIEDFIDEMVFPDSSTANYTEIKVVKEQSRLLCETWWRHAADWKKEVLNPQSKFLQAIETHAKVKSISAQDSSNLLYLYESLKGEITSAAMKEYLKLNPELDLEKTNRAIHDRYPLVHHMNYYNATELPQFAEYVNLIDQAKP
jgi:hypothetical protein